MDKLRLTVVLVNYNVRYFLEQALYAVRRASQRVPCEVFVVDNNSSDDSVEMVKTLFPEVQLIENKENTGFSVANNQAMRLAKGDYVLLLNPDTVVGEETFKKCVDFMDARPKAGGLGLHMIDGKGIFLPESKRGFPAPFVAFCKTFGLSKIFPKSKLFNRYHLGFLSPNETHEIEVLSGAFMLMRKSVLDEVGLLDEAFFMYGEDIDLSYRIVKAGYKNYYFHDSTIIHYKGESTKKGSLNYVRTFYQAMIIFAKKHFQGEEARLFILMLQGAIYFRGILSLAAGFFRKIMPPLLDGLILYAGLILLKNFWAERYYHDPDYYPTFVISVVFPAYVGIWLAGIFFSGGYDQRYNILRLLRGLAVGTFFLAAVYGFLPISLRSSRFLVASGAVWGAFTLTAFRYLNFFIKNKNLNISSNASRNLIIIGKEDESQRVRQLIYEAQVSVNFIGTVAPDAAEASKGNYLGELSQLERLLSLFKVKEVIFCSGNLPFESIIAWMKKLGPTVDYKIVAENSLSIIGSNSKDTVGELYTMEVRYQIMRVESRRNKRLLDLFTCLCMLPFLPLLAFRQKGTFLKSWILVLVGRKSWVGYDPKGRKDDLPKLKPGVFSPTTGLKIENSETLPQRLNFFYAKDYELQHDWEIIWRGVF